MPLVVLLAAMALTACLTTKHGPKYIEPDTVDFQAILPNPPANGSKQTRAELNDLLVIQASRTPEQVSRARAESPPRPELFAPLIGPTFDFEKHPHTYNLLRQVEVDTKAVAERAKRHWARTRPYILDPAIDPAVDKPSSTSYPSTDAAIASAWAVVLQQLFPEKKSELLARANEIGFDRIVAGVHYHSDVVAGGRLGQAIAAKILESKLFQSDLAVARKELNRSLRSQ
jgi:acid phosphatase (class A)